jgi:trk system potassium uptake protein
MYVLIVGGGRVGLTLASSLSQDGTDVTLIENDPKICKVVSEEIDAMVIRGSGTDMKILKEANIANVDVFVAATGSDETNLMACILAKDYNPKKIIARVSDTTHKNIFRKAGVDCVISPEIAAAKYIENIVQQS